jgi:hypothetical protein
MKVLFSMLVFLAGLILAAGGPRADTLLIDAMNQAPPNRADGLVRPTRGMSMARVEQEFGPPSDKTAPVGSGGLHPPITRWDYPGFSVYFEYQFVLTSVVHRGN